jgi:GNAT superfamily N-acetyltransferase
MSDTALILESENYQPAAEVLARAFQVDPLMCTVLKAYSREERVRLMTVVFGAELETSGPRNVSLEVSRDGEVVGASLIHNPGGYPASLSLQAGLLWRGFAAARSFSATGRWMKMMNAFARKHPKDPHYYLEILGVDQSWQGQGIASRMLKQLTMWADEEGSGCYLENSNRLNLPLYQRFGFHTTSQEEVMGVPVWFMWRSPEPASS